MTRQQHVSFGSSCCSEAFSALGCALQQCIQLCRRLPWCRSLCIKSKLVMMADRLMEIFCATFRRVKQDQDQLHCLDGLIVLL